MDDQSCHQLSIAGGKSARSWVWECWWCFSHHIRNMVCLTDTAVRITPVLSDWQCSSDCCDHILTALILWKWLATSQIKTYFELDKKWKRISRSLADRKRLRSYWLKHHWLYNKATSDAGCEKHHQTVTILALWCATSVLPKVIQQYELWVITNTANPNQVTQSFTVLSLEVSDTWSSYLWE